MKSSIVPVFIAVVSLYILYRTYSVHQNYILVREGQEIAASVDFRNLENHSLLYSYTINDKKHTKSEEVDMHTFTEKLPGDAIMIFVKTNDPKTTVIKDNKKAFSYISFGRSAESDPLVIPLWIGYLFGVLLLFFGVYQYLRKFKKTKKTFDS